MFWRRQWHPTPVLLHGKSHRRRSPVGCSPRGREESDTTSLSLSLFTFIHWRRNWQPTPVFLPGESQGWGSLVGCRLCGSTESDTTEATQQQQQQKIMKYLKNLKGSRASGGSRNRSQKAFRKSGHALFNPHLLPLQPSVSF